MDIFFQCSSMFCCSCWIKPGTWRSRINPGIWSIIPLFFVCRCFVGRELSHQISQQLSFALKPCMGVISYDDASHGPRVSFLCSCSYFEVVSSRREATYTRKLVTFYSLQETFSFSIKTTLTILILIRDL